MHYIADKYIIISLRQAEPKETVMKIIDKNNLDEIQQITLITENCESFAVSAEYILDAQFTISDRNRKTDSYDTFDGYIKFANEAADITEMSDDDDVDGCTLGERLLGYCDVTSADILFKDGYSMCVCFPYNPLEESMHGTEIELSNCPSIEFDENCDLVFAFGSMSKQFKRVDNNYSDLVLGWKDEFGDNCPDVIKCRLDRISFSGSDYDRKLDVSFKSCNLPGKSLDLSFVNVTDCDMNILFDQKYCELRMSRMSTGKIYVDISYTMTFFCSCIYVSGYDFDKDFKADESAFDDDTFFKALYFTLPENVMRDFAYARRYPHDASVYIDHERILRALEAYLGGSLTRDFLHHWLYFYKSMIDMCDFHNELFKKVYAVLDILYFSLCYKLSESTEEKFVRKSYDRLKNILG